MHEMGIAIEIVRIVVASIPGDMTDPKVARINMKVGKLSAVVPQSLQYCFEIAAKDGPVEGAELHIEQIGISASCNDCDHLWEITEPAFQCPQCQGGSIEMQTGRELDIDTIELVEE